MKLPYLLCTAVLAGCSSPIAKTTPQAVPIIATAQSIHSHAKIRHIVIVVQENRSFDNLFATYPGANGQTWGWNGNIMQPLVKSPLLQEYCDPNHLSQAFGQQYDFGAMDGFARVNCWTGSQWIAAGLLPYQYTNPADVKPYWKLAKEYVLADNFFQTQTSASFTAHQDLIAGGTRVSLTSAVIDNPTNSPWGCSSPQGTLTNSISNTNQVTINSGPFPCYAYRTIRDLLDAKHLSWKYYVPEWNCPPNCSGAGALWNAFDAIAAVRCATFTPPSTCVGYGAEWRTHVIMPETTVLTDASTGNLPAVSWVIPDADNSDHLLTGTGNHDTGPSWVASVVNAVGEGPDWDTSVVIVLWDDWGGWYDHVAPPQPFRPFGELGFRVPMLLISPWAKRNFIAHTQYEDGSILKLVEDHWNLGNLGQSDAIANSLTDCFDPTRKTPRPFHPIKAQYSREFFLHQRPSNKPVDTE